MLNRRAQRVLDRPAVEAADRLKLIERDDNRPPARLGETRRQREHVAGEPRDVAIRARAGKRHARIGADLRARRRNRVAQPRARPIPGGFGRQERRQEVR